MLNCEGDVKWTFWESFDAKQMVNVGSPYISDCDRIMDGTLMLQRSSRTGSEPVLQDKLIHGFKTCDRSNDVE